MGGLLDLNARTREAMNREISKSKESIEKAAAKFMLLCIA